MPLRRSTVRAFDSRRLRIPCGIRGLLRVGGTTRPTRVPSSWFRTTSTAYSARQVRVYCTPLPAMRFIAFRATALGDCPPEREPSSLASAFPRDAGHTLQRVLSASSRTASLRPLPSCRYHSSPPPSPRRFGPRPARTMLRSTEVDPHVIRLSSARGLPSYGTRCRVVRIQSALRRSSQLQGFAPLSECVAAILRCQRGPPVPSMGFVPLRGSYTARSRRP
jgi:hypothetical protein